MARQPQKRTQKKPAAKRTPGTKKKASAKKKPAPRKKPSRRRTKKSPSLSGQLFRVLAGMTLLVALVVAAGFLLHQAFRRPAPVTPPAAPEPAGQAAVKPPPFEVYPEKDVPVRPPVPERKPPVAGLPKVSIIIDDLGYDRKLAERFLSLDAVMTASILPLGPASRRIARMANEKGWEVMLHLPMEPNEYPQVNPGPGALLTSMTADELIAELNRDIDSIPGVRGVNNHMGSKMTRRSTQLYQIFSILKKRGLYFIDSRTTPETVGRPSARLFQLRFAERDVFIDHLQDPAFIRKQIRHLIETAESHGEAIGIAHPHELTAKIFEEMLPELKERVELVPASAVVHPVG
jgi:polysaccharide deacetylase 2 family uncharacterized protein YibQ